MRALADLTGDTLQPEPPFVWPPVESGARAATRATEPGGTPVSFTLIPLETFIAACHGYTPPGPTHP